MVTNWAAGEIDLSYAQELARSKRARPGDDLVSIKHLPVRFTPSRRGG